MGVIWPLMLVIAVACGVFALPTLGVRTRADRRRAAVAAERERQRSAARTAELEAENERLRKAMGETP